MWKSRKHFHNFQYLENLSVVSCSRLNDIMCVCVYHPLLLSNHALSLIDHNLSNESEEREEKKISIELYCLLLMSFVP